MLYIVAFAMISISIKFMSVKLSKAHNLAWRKFLVAHAMLIEQIEQDLAQAELPPLSWYDVLFTLSEAPEQRLRLHELAQAVLLSRSNLTRLVDRLEVAGLIQREQCPSDRRGAFAVITDEGFKMLNRMWTVYGQAIEKYFACHLDANEVKFLVKILNRLTNARDT
ncbi:MarR family transcriptional regulator [filamentous cyanobacterium CCP1]|nr:MarR family transcriptional regulator [filamentous cyanobacterium CCP2]PSB66880.1 MarR family transcriptional regulator [filamentous cyanobacterium CCP1]